MAAVGDALGDALGDAVVTGLSAKTRTLRVANAMTNNIRI
jgi:hypothetical protein